MNTHPQTIAKDIAQGINALIAESDRFRDENSPEVRLLSASIEKLQKVDARLAFISRGALAAVCGNVAEVLTCFQKAILLPEVEFTKHEFWATFGNVGLYGKASELGSWLLEPRRNFFPSSWQRAFSFGQILEVSERLPLAMKAYPELARNDYTLLNEVAAMMHSGHLNDHVLISILDLMGEIQRAHGVMFAGQDAAHAKVIAPPDDPPYLYLSMQIDADVVEIHAMNRELGRAIVERYPFGAFPEGLVAAFTKAHCQVLRAAA